MRIRVAFAVATCILCACIGVSSPAWATQTQQGSAASPEVTCTQPLTVRIGESVMAGMILRRVQPIYPEITRMGRLSGTVILHATVSRDGSVNQLQVVSGPMLLRESALDAVRQWQYKPYLLNGEPVDVDTTISVVFKLDSGKNASAAGQSGGAQNAGGSPAQKATNAPAAGAEAPIDAQFKANILKLLDLTHAMSLGHDAAARMLQSLRPTLIAALPPTPHREQIADAYSDKLTSLLTGQEMANQLVEIYARHLSADDVNAMIQFYDTPAGQHSLAALPQIMAESQQLGSNVAQENLPRILRELCTEFPELRGKVKFCPAGTGNESSEWMENEWPVVRTQWSTERNAAERWPTAAQFVTVALHRSVPVAQQSADSGAVEAPESEMEARLIHVVPPVYRRSRSSRTSAARLC